MRYFVVRLPNPEQRKERLALPVAERAVFGQRLQQQLKDELCAIVGVSNVTPLLTHVGFEFDLPDDHDDSLLAEIESRLGVLPALSDEHPDSTW